MNISGQTSTGKTYTMSGKSWGLDASSKINTDTEPEPEDDDGHGVIPRSIAAIYESTSLQSESKYALYCSLLEVGRYGNS